MIGCLWTRVRKQPIIALYFEFENELKFYKLGARFLFLFVIFRYQSAQPDFVDYLKFCDEVESIFTTKELEKTPLEEVIQFRAPEEWEMNKLPEAQEERFMTCMNRLAEKVHG